MIHSQTGARVVGAIAGLAVIALLAVPFFYVRYTTSLRSGITLTLEPAHLGGGLRSGSFNPVNQNAGKDR